jgi:hypothetical protein
MMAEYLAMPEPLAGQWWRALEHARWSAAVSLRQQVQWASTDPGVKFRTPSPQELVQVTYNLVSEARLSPQSAHTITEAILARTDKAGQWRAV